MPDQDYLVTSLHEFKQDEDDDEDEAPSLCDLPLTAADTVDDIYRHSLTDPAESFEFLTPNFPELSWNDIVWPSLTSSPPPSPPPPLPPSSTKTRRFESFNESNAAADRSSLPSSRSMRVNARRRSPPWYRLVLRPLRITAAPEIRETRSPSLARLFPEEDSCDRRAWRLISVLSCKRHGSVAVTTPFHPPHCSASA